MAAKQDHEVGDSHCDGGDHQVNEGGVCHDYECNEDDDVDGVCLHCQGLFFIGRSFLFQLLDNGCEHNLILSSFVYLRTNIHIQYFFKSIPN